MQERVETQPLILSAAVWAALKPCDCREGEIPLAAIWAPRQGWSTRAVLGAEMHILLFK